MRAYLGMAADVLVNICSRIHVIMCSVSIRVSASVTEGLSEITHSSPGGGTCLQSHSCRAGAGTRVAMKNIDFEI